jgi:TrmH family RNA methyltransferase
VKLIEEAIKENIAFDFVFMSESLSNKSDTSKLIKALDESRIEYHLIENNLFKEVSNTVNSQGIIGIAKKPKNNIEAIIKNNNFMVFCDKLQDPGNLGTIIRTADAFGPCAVILSPNCVDAYNDKTVRACAGAIFRVPIAEIENSLDFMKSLQDQEFTIISTVIDSDKSFEDISKPKKICLIIGNEGNGVSKELKEASDECITIKMTGQTESLNASIAAAISIYEIRKKL